jgi:CheY-like chemotaxis protein
MVVEDEPEIYELLLAMFEMWGIECAGFVDGESAAEWIDAVNSGRYRGEVPELALVDVRLPGRLNGLDVAEKLRNSNVLGDMAIVMATAWKLNQAEYQEATRRTRADLWLPKPLPRFNQLQNILETVIKKRQIKNTQNTRTTRNTNDYSKADF